MDLTAASEHLRDMLEVTDDRYSPGIRAAHLNQAIGYLGKRYETSYNEGVGYINVAAGETSFIASSLVDAGGNSIVGEVVEALYYVKSFTVVGANPGAWTPNEGWTKIQIYSSLEALYDAVKHVDSEDDDDVYGAAQRGGVVYILNAQDEDMLVRAIFNGPHAETAFDNSWLIYAPWPVIYKAAMYACVYLEDEARIPVYEKLLEDAVEVVNLADSMKNDGPMSMQEV